MSLRAVNLPNTFSRGGNTGGRGGKRKKTGGEGEAIELPFLKGGERVGRNWRIGKTK